MRFNIFTSTRFHICGISQRRSTGHVWNQLTKT